MKIKRKSVAFHSRKFPRWITLWQVGDSVYQLHNILDYQYWTFWWTAWGGSTLRFRLRKMFGMYRYAVNNVGGPDDYEDYPQPVLTRSGELQWR